MSSYQVKSTWCQMIILEQEELQGNLSIFTLILAEVQKNGLLLLINGAELVLTLIREGPVFEEVKFEVKDGKMTG